MSATRAANKARPSPRPPRSAFDESVYDLIPEEYVAPPKQKRYESIYTPKVRREYQADAKDMASMGPLKVGLKSAADFLKKRESERVLPRVAAGEKKKRAPIVPPPPVMPKATQQDYVKVNALQNINAVPKKPVDKSVNYLHKKDYGSTPSYLLRRKEELARRVAEEETVRAQRAAEERNRMQYHLPEEERQGILGGLKANWEKLNAEYQKLSLTVDTVPKITRKVNMEAELKRIEEDIAKFSHPNLIINMTH